MLVVIDESGCPGFKQGSSTHFVIGMVIFESYSDAEEAANIIKKLKADVGFRREFRFSSCDNRKRDMFFDAVQGARFSVRLFVVEKRLIYSSHLRRHNEKFVSYCLKNLMQDAGGHVQDAVIKIDGKGSKVFKQGCKSYLRRELPAGFMKDLKFCNSENDVLVQMADMMVSAYSRPYNSPNKTDSFKWRNMIDSKIKKVWNFM